MDVTARRDPATSETDQGTRNAALQQLAAVGLE